MRLVESFSLVSWNPKSPLRSLGELILCGRAILGQSSCSSDKESIVKEAKLQLKEGLKSVLMSNLCISDEDVDRLLEQAGESGN